MIIFLLILVFFLGSEISVQKGLYPKFLKKLTAGKLIMFSLGTLLGLAAISFFIKDAVILLLLGTIYFSVIISNHYMNGFSKMERGRKIWPNAL